MPVAPRHVLQVQRRHAAAGRGRRLRRLQSSGNGAATAFLLLLGALTAVTFAVLLLTRRRSLLGALSAEGGGRAGTQPRPVAAERGRGELEVAGECMLLGGGRLAAAVVMASPAGPGLPGRAFGPGGRLFGWGGIFRAPTHAASEPGLSCDLGQGEALHAAVHVLVQFGDALSVIARY